MTCPTVPLAASLCLASGLQSFAGGREDATVGYPTWFPINLRERKLVRGQEVLMLYLILMEKTRRKVRPIARKRHNYIYLLASILFAISTGYILFNFPPEYKIEISNFNIPVQIPILPIFFLSLSVFVFSLITFLFFRKIQGAIFVIFILGYIAMRLAGLTHFIFLILVIALFATIELFILKKK